MCVQSTLLHFYSRWEGEVQLPSIFVEKNCCPAWYETRLSCKPEQYQQYEEGQNCYFSKFHWATFLALFLDNVIAQLLFSLCSGICSTTKTLPKTRRKWTKNYHRHLPGILRVKNANFIHSHIVFRYMYLSMLMEMMCMQHQQLGSWLLCTVYHQHDQSEAS